MVKIKNRQLEIVLYLNEVEKSTIKELSERFEVSKRTIMRDIDKISSFGIPIHTQAGYRGGVFIPKGNKFERSFFSDSEIEELVLAIHIINGIRKNNKKSSILKKLELLTPELTYLKEFDFSEYLKIELFDEKLVSDDHIFEMINKSLDEEKFFKITIDNQIFNIEPLNYVLRSSGLFLEAVFKEDIMLFEVLKIEKCELLDKEFKRGDYVNILKK